MYSLLGASLALAVLLTINAFASLLAAALWRGVVLVGSRWSAERRARFLFLFRIFPVAAATIGVAALFIPSYLAYEPRSSGEVVSFKLAAFALVSALGIVLAIWRAWATLRATRRLVADWMRHAEPISLEGISIPAYGVEHQFPVIAVVGVIRPRLFISSRIFTSLNEDELKAAVAHEAGHLAAHDNLKRWMVRACRDVLVIFPGSRTLDRAWAEATEAAADEHAARAGAAPALDLASALIKIARMVPQGAVPVMPAGAFLISEETGVRIETRVRHLVRLAERDSVRDRENSRILSILTWTGFSTVLGAVAVSATSPRLLSGLHAGVEQFVKILS